MRYRPVDNNGDMMPVGRTEDMLSGVDAVAAAINSRLHLQYGEWWEDERAGFELPPFLINRNRLSNPGIISSYIADYISKTPGVRSVTDVIAEKDDRKLKFNVKVSTEYGTMERSVTEHELLRTVY